MRRTGGLAGPGPVGILDSMLVDLHSHTLPASRCSDITHQEYVEACVAAGITVIALTNHGNVTDNLPVEKALAERGITLIHGVEISTMFGDMLVFSPDVEYLGRFLPVQPPPRASQIPDHAAVVWAHPAGGGGMSGATYFPGLEQQVVPLVHAIEVYNGNWPSDHAVATAERIAADFNMPATGGSDAHRASAIMRCATDIEPAPRSTEDVVAAIREGRVRPWRDPARAGDERVRFSARRRPWTS